MANDWPDGYGRYVSFDTQSNDFSQTFVKQTKIDDPFEEIIVKELGGIKID